ncbi:hypothetical protein RZY48_003578 [Vibrio navarrensis]|uniref:Tyr recombinase domain-containing protein n=1 Tax=Vibrio navarrensis TaxID=29495 RepID=A0AAI9GA39_9VIBR|nr:hypothetical protein [Vibrio navarrensis]
MFNPKVVREQKRSDYSYYGKRALGRIWTGLCQKAGILHRNQYQLRHTYASWMITHANVNVSYLAQQMGHADVACCLKKAVLACKAPLISAGRFFSGLLFRLKPAKTKTEPLPLLLCIAPLHSVSRINKLALNP